MDINVLRSIFTVVIFVAFIAIWIWAWGKKRKDEFEEAANMPFNDEAPHKSSKGAEK